MTPDPRRLTTLLLLPLLVLLAACSSPEAKVAKHLAKAEAFMVAEDWKKAALEARNAVQIQPKNAQAHLILAKLDWRESKFPDAFSHLSMAVEAEPTLVEARLRLGELHFASGDVDGLAAQAEAVRKLAPGRADTHMLSARLLYLRGDLPGAMVEVDAALAADPKHIPAITAKAGLLGGKGDNAGALAVVEAGLAAARGGDLEALHKFRLGLLRASGDQQAYEEALLALIRQFPDQTDYRYQLLDFYAGTGRFDDEERALRALVASDPDNARPRLRLARRLIGKQELAAAETLLKEGVASHPDSAELKLALGDYYRATKRPAEAMAVYRQAVEQWPETTPEGLQARNRVVAQHTVDGNIQQARADLDAILKVVPDDAEALLSRGIFALIDGRYDAAIADLRIAQRRGESTQAALLLARAYVGKGDMAVAKDTYRTLLDRDPGNAAATRELAVLLAGEGDATAATRILRELVASRPDDAEASAALVQSLLAQRELAAAEAEARRGMDSGAGGLLGEQQLGQVLQARGANAEALTRYRAVLARDPAQRQALEGLVGILLDTGRVAEAIDFLKDYPRDNLDAALLLGKAYVQQGDPAAARAVHEQAIAQAPTDVRAYLALAALAPTDSPQQVAALQRGLKAVPGNPALGIFLGSIHERQGRPAEAIAVYEAVWANNPGDTMMANNLAALLLDHGKDKKSLTRALELTRGFASTADPILLDTLGWAYFRNDDFPNAVLTLERAVAADQEHALLQYHLGKAYAAAGNPVGARQHLLRALEKGGDQAAFADDARVSLGRAGS